MCRQDNVDENSRPGQLTPKVSCKKPLRVSLVRYTFVYVYTTLHHYVVLYTDSKDCRMDFFLMSAQYDPSCASRTNSLVQQEGTDVAALLRDQTVHFGTLQLGDEGSEISLVSLEKRSYRTRVLCCISLTTCPRCHRTRVRRNSWSSPSQKIQKKSTRDLSVEWSPAAAGEQQRSLRKLQATLWIKLQLSFRLKLPRPFKHVLQTLHRPLPRFSLLFCTVVVPHPPHPHFFPAFPPLSTPAPQWKSSSTSTAPPWTTATSTHRPAGAPSYASTTPSRRPATPCARPATRALRQATAQSCVPLSGRFTSSTSLPR